MNLLAASKLLVVLSILFHYSFVYSQEAEVQTGIANTGKMTIKGDVNIEVHLTPNIGDFDRIV